MAYPQTAPALPMQVPTGGINARDPLASMDPRYSPFLLNAEPEPWGLKLRNAWRKHAKLTSADLVLALGTYGETKLFAYTQKASANNLIYDVTAAGDQSSTTAVHDVGAGTAFLHIKPTTYANRFAFISSQASSNPSRVYNGSSWTATGWTSGGAAISGNVQTSYKGRVYIFNGQKMYYSDLEGVTGATTEVDFSTRFKRSDDVMWADVLSVSNGSTTNAFLAFGNGAGEILVYQGDYPASATWQLVSQFKCDPPISYAGAIAINNDVYILTETGVVSLRKLFTATGGEDVTISDLIRPLWTKIVRGTKITTGLLGVQGTVAQWSDQNKLYIFLRGSVDKDGVFSSSKNTIFVYNLVSQAWAMHHVDGTSYGMVYFNGALYRASDNLVLKYDLTKWADVKITDTNQHNGYPFSIYSAYANFGSTKKTKELIGFEPLIKTDLAGALSVRVAMAGAADFGRKVSADTVAQLIDGYNTPTYKAGVMGTYFQARINGNSDPDSEDGFELYAMGAIVK